MAQSDVRSSPVEHILCGFLLACILFATIFLFMQNSWSSPAVPVTQSTSSSTSMQWYQPTTTTVNTVSSSTQMIWYPGPTHGAASSFVSTSSSSTPMIWYPGSPASSFSSSVASLGRGPRR